jgi:endonuclease/exonuclease/phosphatase family metal-dependent hydrolase
MVRFGRFPRRAFAASPFRAYTSAERSIAAEERQKAVSAFLRVITYNIRKGKGSDGRSAIEMSALGAALAPHEADVVLCQEVFHSSRDGAWQSSHLAEAMGLESYYGANKFRAIGHHGNTTLTRLKVERFVNHDISTNRIERRGALYVRLDVGGKPLHVWNVHLGLNGWQRLTQMKRIAATLAEQTKPGEAVLLAGDFNDWRRELDPVIVDQLGFCNAFAKNGPEMGRTWHARRPVFALDRIYVRDAQIELAQRLDGEPWSGLSDHLPLLAELRV